MTTLLDLFNNTLLTFRLASDPIKALIIVVPPAFVLGFYALCIWSVKIKQSAKPAKEEADDEIVYSMRRNLDGTLTTYRHRQPVTPVKIPLKPGDSDPVPLHLVRQNENETKGDGEKT